MPNCPSYLGCAIKMTLQSQMYNAQQVKLTWWTWEAFFHWLCMLTKALAVNHNRPVLKK